MADDKEDTKRTLPMTPRLPSYMSKNTENEVDVDLVALARAVSAQSAQIGKTSPRERMLIAAITLLLSGTGTGAAVTGAFSWLNTLSPEAEERLEKLERAVFDESGRNRIEEMTDISRDTYDIVNAAHPPRGRVGVPEPAKENQ